MRFLLWSMIGPLAGCSGTGPLFGDAGAAGSDAGVSESDAAPMVEPDAGVVESPPPTTGCFAEPVELVRDVVPAGNRAHAAPSALVAHAGGWVTLYTGPGGPAISLLDWEGRVRDSESVSVFQPNAVLSAGSSLVFVEGVHLYRVDFAGDSIERQFGRTDVVSSIRDVAVVAPGVVRVISTPWVGGEPELHVRDFELDDSAADGTGFVIRQSRVTVPAELGSPAGFQYEVRGDRMLLLGVGSYAPVRWRAATVELDARAIGSGPVEMRVLDDQPWDVPEPEGWVRPTSDWQRALVTFRAPEHLGETHLVPLPPGSVRVEESPRFDAVYEMLEHEGTMSFLTRESLSVFRTSDLEPLAALPFDEPLSATFSANHGDRAAVLYQLGGGSSEARIMLRCLAVPQ
jgi:hypothetical protein